jgi:signal transduction histidine kinase
LTLSLRTQLLLWLGLAVLALIFVVTFLSQEVIVWNMERAIDDTLQERAHMVAAIVSSDITTDEESYAYVIGELSNQELPFVPLLLRVVSPSGRVIINFGEVTAPIANNLDRQLQSSNVSGGHLDTIKPEGVTPLRVYTISVTDPRTGEILALVQAADSLEQVAQAKRHLWQNGIIVGLGGSSLAIALGLVLIRRGFRPLGTILQTIDEVDYYHLKSRLKEENRPAELEQLARSLTAMLQRLDKTVSERQESLGSVSHDLRTPLSTLQGHLEVLLLQPSMSAEVRDSLEHMLRETRRLIRLVKNMLLNVQLESKPALIARDVSLGELLDEVVGDIWILVEGLQFNVIAPSDVTVYGDRDLLKQMLLNIVDNAIKFTPKGGKIELTLTSDEDWVVLEVSDTGQGISSDDLPYVTHAFYKPRTSRRSTAAGTGLGLSIVRQVAELHSGELEIRSQEGVGTLVRVRLPKKVMIALPERK